MGALVRAALALLLVGGAGCEDIKAPTNPSGSMVPPGARPPTLETPPGTDPDAGSRDATPAMGPETPI
jgi:hypothetical protein